MVHSEGIWNDLELQRSFWNKAAFACIMTLYETIIDTAMRKTVHILTSSMWREVGQPQSLVFENWLWLAHSDAIWNDFFFWYSEKFENKAVKWCILPTFETSWCCYLQNILKAVKLNGAFWRFFNTKVGNQRI